MSILQALGRRMRRGQCSIRPCFVVVGDDSRGCDTFGSGYRRACSLIVACAGGEAAESRHKLFWLLCLTDLAGYLAPQAFARSPHTAPSIFTAQ
mmetsp:Transcript_90091/g.288980  ORF Transcript_90091/g.288980 Transcript_90091/m.288980 type:complete len:94 (+) Transcript_90091:1759-2040(+)